MAPLLVDNLVLHIGGISGTARQFQRRDLNIQTFLTATVILSLLSGALFAGLVIVVLRIWLQRRAGNAAQSPHPEISKEDPAQPRRQSDWLRKNSNVLWSMYFEDDDLKAQFGPPTSRLYSIGSVSTVDNGRCPLDRGALNAHDIEKQQNICKDPSRLEIVCDTNDGTDLADRTPSEHETKPTQSSRPRSRSHPLQKSADGLYGKMRARKHSLPLDHVGLETCGKW